MGYYNIVKVIPSIILQTDNKKVSIKQENGKYVYEDIEVELLENQNRLNVMLRAESTPVCKVWLVWNIKQTEECRICGDAWERGYGDLEWRGIVPERIMPWYFMVNELGKTHGYGVETGTASMCFWKMDKYSIRLCVDVRNGAQGVMLQGRVLKAATVVSREGKAGEKAFEATKEFCRLMCRKPRLPKQLVYGSNNWYYAYGNSSAEQIRKDAHLLAELTEGLECRPYMVIDDGWQLLRSDCCSGGPWNQGNFRFTDMKVLADDIKALNLKAGLWFRPLKTYECYPCECYLPKRDSASEGNSGGKTLDPSHPYVLEKVEEMVKHIVSWGYSLIKHDFSTYDIFGRWGFDMGEELTEDGWHFYDRSKTTAEIILEFYEAIRKGAGNQALVLGCNTISHLAAGIFELQRTGDDTSGVEWERTRKMGVNTLAFRMPQNGTFYAADADCVGMTGQIDWELNKEWISVLTISGTPMFVSIDPDKVTPEQKEYMKQAFQKYVMIEKEAIPCDWLTSTCPDTWDTVDGVRQFCFSQL